MSCIHVIHLHSHPEIKMRDPSLAAERMRLARELFLARVEWRKMIKPGSPLRNMLDRSYQWAGNAAYSALLRKLVDQHREVEYLCRDICSRLREANSKVGPHDICDHWCHVRESLQHKLW